MALFTAVGAAIGAAATFVTTTAVGQFLGSVALNALASALFAPDAPDPQAQDRRIERQARQGIVPRSFIVGRYATGGSLVFHASGKVGSYDDDTENYFVVYALSDLPVRDLSGMWIDGKKVTLNDGPGGKLENEGYTAYHKIPEFNDDEDDDGASKGWYRFYDGTQTVADEILVENASSAEYPWAASAVGRGMAYVVMIHDYDPNLYPNFPEVLFEVEGIPLTRPDGAVPHPDSGWHDAPAAQIHHILRGVEYAGQWLYGPQKTGLMDEAHWNAAVADCRLPVPGASGWSDSKKEGAFGSTTVPARYRAGLEVNVSRPISETISDLASACNGRFSEVAGAWRFQVGDPKAAPDFTFSDDDILTTREQSFSMFLPLAETVNAVTAVYPDPEQQYEDQEPKPRYRPDLEVEDGNRRLTTSTRLDAVPYKEQVQRLMKSALDEARRARRHTIVLPARFWAVEPGDYAGWTSPRNGYASKLFRVDGVTDEAGGEVVLDLTEVDPSDYDFDAEDFVPVTSGSLFNPGAPTFAALNFAVAPSFVSGAGGAKRPAIDLSWGTDRPARGVIYRVYLAGTSAIVSSGSTEDYQSGLMPISAGILSLTDYEVQAKRQVRNGRAEWSARLPVTTGDYRLGPSDLSAELQATIDEAVGEGQTAQERFDAIVAAIDPDSGMTQQEASDAGVAALRLFSGDVMDFATNFVGLTAQTVNGEIAGFQAASWDDPDGGGSTLKLLGNQVLIPGSVYATDLTLTDLNNLIPDANLAGGTLDPWESAAGNIIARERGTGGSSAVASAPTKWIFASEDGSSEEIARLYLTDDQRIPVSPGERIRIKFKYAGGGSPINRNIKVRASFTDASGAGTGTIAPEVTATSVGWNEFSADASVPDGSAYLHRWDIHFYAGAGAGFVADPRAYRMNAAELVVDGGITAAKLDAVSLRVAGVSVFGGTLESDNAGASSGEWWRIQNNGNAYFNNIIVRGSIKQGVISEQPYFNMTSREYVGNDDGWETLTQMTVDHSGGPCIFFLKLEASRVDSQPTVRVRIYDETANDAVMSWSNTFDTIVANAFYEDFSFRNRSGTRTYTVEARSDNGPGEVNWLQAYIMDVMK